MKVIRNTLIVLLVTGSFCFAQSPIIPVKLSAQEKREIKTIKGTVESVFLEDQPKGIRSAIVVSTDNDQHFIILVNYTTTIYDISQGAINLEKIKKDNTVKVKYVTTKEGGNKALSIYLLKH